YQRPAVVTPPLKENVTPRMERLEGFKQEVKNNEIPFSYEYIVSGEMDELEEKLKILFELPKAPDAIFAINDRVLHEIMSVFNKHHIRISNLVALLNVDDVSFSDFYQPALTTVSQPYFQIGKKAAEILFEYMKFLNVNKSKEIHRFEPSIKRRESC